MNATLLFPSKYLRAADFNGRAVTKTIKAVRVDELKTSEGTEQKPVIYFADTKKMLVLNKTNCKAIVKHLGKETDDWSGAALTMYATTCTAFGETVDCVRVKSASPAKGKQPPKQDAEPVTEPEPAAESDDEPPTFDPATGEVQP